MLLVIHLILGFRRLREIDYYNRTEFRFVFTGKKIKKPQRGPLQLDLFEPLDLNYEYRVIVTNKTESAKAVVLFHNGRGYHCQCKWWRIRSQGELTFTMSSNRAVRKDLLHFMDVLQKAA